MAPELTGEAWAQIRYDYEHTDRPIGDICAEHGISTGTLRDRVRRWNWTPRRLPIPFEGPPPAPPADSPPLPAARAFDVAAPPAAASQSEPPTPDVMPQAVASGEAGALPPYPACGRGLEGGAPDDNIVPRLQGAVARVLPAIEATVARLAAGPTHPREMERAGRALAALTRTLRELNGLLSQRQAAAPGYRPRTEEELDEMRRELAERIHAFVDERQAARRAAGEAAGEDGEPQREG